jgi:hypothetical protein
MSLRFFQRGLAAYAAYAAFAGISCATLNPAWAFELPKTAPAAALPKGVASGPSVEGITEYRLPNGLKVLLFPDSSRPTITVNVTYLVGSRFENYGETGMAHLLEHMMFKGSPKHPDITRQFQDRGMQFNGTTSFDRTNYYEVFQASQDNLDWALGMEADRMTHSFIAKKDLDSEMTVVRNEYENGENSPTSVLMTGIPTAARPSATRATSRTSRSATCRISITSITSPTTRCCWWPASSMRTRPCVRSASCSARSRNRRARCPSSGPSSRPRMATAASRCGARATCRSLRWPPDRP